MFLDGFKPMKGGRKIDLLINTHHHPDHTGGNKVLQPSVVKIVAHENAPGLQRKQAAAQKSEDAQAYADTTFKTDWKVDLGSEIVSARYYGPGHTSGDARDLLRARQRRAHGRPDVPSAAPARRPSIRRVDSQLARLAREGHEGSQRRHDLHLRPLESGHAGDRAEGDLLALRDYFSAMLDYVQKGIKAGKSADEIVKAGLPQFAANEGAPQLQVAYDELTAKS